MKKIVFLILCLCAINLVSASHLRCGYITVQRSSCTSNTVFITITVFTNTTAMVKFGEDGILDFGDGEQFTVPGVDNIPRPDLGANIGMASYTRQHVYSATGSYIISYQEPNRNGGVINMDDSFNTFFYTETKIDLTADICSSPLFLAPPIFSGITDSELNISLGCESPQGNLITYEMAIPFRDRATTVLNYQAPPNMLLNELTGLLSWNTVNTTPGEYNFAVVATQFRKIEDKYMRAGFIRIDFQVILDDDAPETQELSDDQEMDEYKRILVKPGEDKVIELTYLNRHNNAATLEVFSELDEASISFDTHDVGGPTGEIKLAVLTISPQESDVRENGYLITVRGRTVESVHDMNYLIYTDAIPDFPVDVITGTEKETGTIEVFPNPAQNQVNIHVDKEGAAEVRVYSTQGVLVKVKAFEGNTTLMLSELPAGVYICDVRKNNTSLQRIKLIKTE